MKEKEEIINQEEDSPNKIVVKEAENNIEENGKIQNINNNIINNNNDTQNKLNLISKNTEFDEIIYFSNYFSVFRKIEFNNPISAESNPYILSREFLYSYFEDKRVTKTTSEETKIQVIGRIKQYSITHDDKFTKFFLDNMNSYIEIIGLEPTSNLLLPALAKIVDETVAIKTYFLKKLSPLIDYLSSQGDEGINLLKKNVINILEELYHPRGFEINDDEMKNLLFDNFIKASKSIIPKDKDNYILNMVISFGYEESNNKDFILEHKILCIRFMSKLAVYFGKENAISYLLPQLSFFADETDQSIKKELLKTLPNICEVLPFEVVRTKIFKLIKRIGSDPLWRIRKTCAEILPRILKIYKEKVNEYIKDNINYDAKKVSAKHYLNLIEKFILDEQKFVRVSIIERIGEIITSVDKKLDGLSMKLFNFFKESAENYYFNNSKILSSSIGSGYSISSISSRMSTTSRSKYSQDEINYYFAYNFPAVLFVYGRECWPKLRKIYGNLCNESSPKVRKSILSSFYEICKIVGQENIEIDLLQYYDIFLESEDLKEKNIAIRNLPKILNLVSKEARQKYLEYFEAVSIFQTNAGDKVRSFNFISWKDKLDVIEGILCYYNLYENDIIYKSIIPQCITFCLDSVYKVRTVSSKVLGTLILYLYNENYAKKELFKILECFALHKKFQQRINFIKICKILMNNKNIYNEKIVELLYIISLKEKILNVKIALCKLLKKVLSNDKSPLKEELSLHKLCKILLNKKNKTIENILKSLEIKETNEDIFNEYKNKYSDEDKIFIGNNKYFIEEFKIDYEEENKVNNEGLDELLPHGGEEIKKNKNYNEIIYSERKENDIYSSNQNFIKDVNNANNVKTKENLNNKNGSENINEIKLNINQNKNKNNSIDKYNSISIINCNEEKEDKKES